MEFYEENFAFELSDGFFIFCFAGVGWCDGGGVRLRGLGAFFLRFWGILGGGKFGVDLGEFWTTFMDN
jgi:hypothetical protein